ncbi:prephenate dehydrogenase [Aerococcaceae bacterium DSM 111176]|nr:prephenate dehydrogenase [Aerococcaceae bacterium DSM 111176]
MTKIAIVGLGVVGGSLAKGLKENPVADEEVLAIDINPKTIETALEQGVIDRGETENKTILQEADIVFICLYPNAMRDFLVNHQDEFKKGAILTDVVGVKQALLNQIIDVIPPQVDFIFGHPMAGREKTGFDFADARVLKGANYLLTIRPENTPENIETLSAIIHRIGFKRITNVTPQKHDDMIAFTSQLTHAIAVALVNSDDDYQETVKYVGDSYRDLTRIAKINENLWSELFMTNKESLLPVIDHFQQELDAIRQAVADEDKEALESIFITSTKRREYYDEMDFRTKDKLN